MRQLDTLTILFHLATLAIDVVVLVAVARRPVWQRLAGACVLAAVYGWLASSFFGRGLMGDSFAQLRFLAQGLFLHVPLVLGASAWILRRSARTALAVAVLALAVAGTGVYAFYIEPFRLEVSRYSLESPELDEPWRLVILADYQTDDFGPYERRVWDEVLAQEADLILMTGDYLQIHDRAKREAVSDATRDYLQQIGFQARRGVFAVAGDVEHNDGGKWRELFAGLPVMTFTETRTIQLRGLTLTALDPLDSRSRQLRIPSSPDFHIVFGHAPDYALLDLDADLQIAGHTHGGQVQLPFIGPLITFSRVPRAWAAGWTDLDGGGTLLVSRGVGMERSKAPRMRFLCRPEIIVLELRPTGVADPKVSQWTEATQ